MDTELPQPGSNEMEFLDENKLQTACENPRGVVVVELNSHQPENEDSDNDLMDIMNMRELNLNDSDDDDETTGELAVSVMENIGMEHIEPNIQQVYEVMPNIQHGFEMFPIQNNYEIMSDSSDETMPDFENTVFPAPPVESSASEDEDEEVDPALLNIIGENYANQPLLNLLNDILNNQVRGLER